MSIVALKRKSQRFIDPVSGQHGFSLNGGYRNLRPIGPTNLVALKAKSSCYGNDPLVLKPSVLNTLGYQYAQLFYPTCAGAGRCGPKPVVKDPHNKWRLRRGAPCADVPEKKLDAGLVYCLARRSYRIGGRLVYQNNYSKNAGIGAVPASEYMRRGLLKANCLPTPSNKQSWPMTLLRNGCNLQVQTPAEAIALGLLPADWQG